MYEQRVGSYYDDWRHSSQLNACILNADTIHDWPIRGGQVVRTFAPEASSLARVRYTVPLLKSMGLFCVCVLYACMHRKLCGGSSAFASCANCIGCAAWSRVPATASQPANRALACANVNAISSVHTELPALSVCPTELNNRKVLWALRRNDYTHDGPENWAWVTWCGSTEGLFEIWIF